MKVEDKNITSALLIDDDKFTNFYNEKIVTKHNSFKNVVSVTSGKEALDYLTNAFNNNNNIPDVIFLDLNMPAMNGWEFIEEYKKLDINYTSKIDLVILTTSSNPDDFERSQDIDAVNGYINKPLSLDILDDIIEQRFSVSNSKVSK